MTIITRFFMVLLFAALAGPPAFSQTMLTVEVEQAGKIVLRTDFSKEDLYELGLHQVKTTNTYVDGIKTFEGPLVRDLIAKVGAEKAELSFMVAENDYTVEIPMHEFYDYDAILAMSADGVAFSPRGKGPIWVIYPMSEHKELQEPKFNSRLIWQLAKIVFK